MRKTLVEECRSLFAPDIGHSAAMQEALGDQTEGLFAVRVPGGASLRLRYGATPEGPRRWYWICAGCGKTVEAVYLPPADPRWLCRFCHDLQYQIWRKDRGALERGSHSGKSVADIHPTRKKYRRK